ncbi:Rid family hydrolase [Puniceicoccaceae bacterium K14]|nr:Rid family hydrolase [Puniceicoccaceae bacterium K14]
MKLLPNHKLSKVIIFYALAVVAYLIISYVGRTPNGNLESIQESPALYADLVSVEAGTEYFYTWGVTASPRVMEIARTGTKDRYGDTYQQAYGVLTQLSQDLSEVGLTLKDVVNVRAYVVADPEPDFEAWDRAFSEFFGTANNPHKPARTSIGISRLFHSDYRIEVEFVAVFPSGRGPHEMDTRHNERYERLGRVETSDLWRSYGRPAWPMSTGKATEKGLDYFYSSLVRPASMMPNAPPTFHMYGDITKQADSIFKQMGAQLKEAGLGYEDVYFIRTCVYPGKQSISRSFSSFNKVYNKYFNNSKNPNRPTRTVMSAPGFDYKKQSIAVEYYAAYPDGHEFEDGVVLQSFGESTSPVDRKQVAAGGVAVSREATMLWISGNISKVEGDMEIQAKSAISGLLERLSLKDADLSDLVHLRVYLSTKAGPLLDNDIKAFEKVFESTYEDLDVARKPALTILPIVSLPGGSSVELEALAAIGGMRG